MKVAIIGTHCTGKTTLCIEIAEAVRARGKSVAIIEEAVRSCPFPANDDTTLAAQQWILAHQIKAELEAERTHDVVLCDRGVPDNYMYLLRRFPAKEGALTPFVLDHCASYDLIIKTVIEGQATPDGFRSTEDAFREEIDSMLTRFLAIHKMPHVVLSGRDRSIKALSLMGVA